MRVRCNDCGTNAEFTLESWRCECGGAWEPVFPSGFDPDRINEADYSIWRYGDLLPLNVHQASQVMGVGWTPLVPVNLAGREVHLKLEFLSPSGSFKDRGVNAMVNQLAAMGASSLAEDSSGNAGASLAAHAARFGLEAEVFVPATTSPAKIRQIASMAPRSRPFRARARLRRMLCRLPSGRAGPMPPMLITRLIWPGRPPRLMKFGSSLVTARRIGSSCQPRKVGSFWGCILAFSAVAGSRFD